MYIPEPSRDFQNQSQHSKSWYSKFGNDIPQLSWDFHKIVINTPLWHIQNRSVLFEKKYQTTIEKSIDKSSYILWPQKLKYDNLLSFLSDSSFYVWKLEEVWRDLTYELFIELRNKFRNTSIWILESNNPLSIKRYKCWGFFFIQGEFTGMASGFATKIT